MKKIKLSVFSNVCENCGKDNAECVAFKKKGFWFLPDKETFICQTCISRAFGSFRKGK